MNWLLRRATLLSSVLLLCAGPHTWAQWPQVREIRENEPSHILLGTDGIDREQAEKLLAQRLRHSKDLQQTRGLIERLLKNPEALGMKREDLLKMMAEVGKQQGKIDPNDPRWRDLLPRLDQSSISPEEKDALKRLAEEWKKEAETATKPPDQGNSETGKPPDVGMNPMVTPPIPPPITPPTTEPPPNPVVEPRPAADPAFFRKRETWFTKMMNKLAPERDNLRNAPRPLKDLLGKDNAVRRWSNEWSSSARDWTRGMMPNLRTEGLTHGLRGLMPRLDRHSSVLRGLNLNVRPPAMGGLQGVDAREVGVAATGGAVTVGVVVVLGVFAALLIAFAMRREGLLGRGGNRDEIGAWPVRPGEVRTRSDLVRAFEYLALLMLGRSIESANHHEIADRLGADDLAGEKRRRQAALELARLYEQARYAPPEENLSEDELTTARQDLALLAGGAQ